MADRIRIWTVDENEGRESALPLEELTSTETEQRLEELLVTSPDLLAPGLSLIGRQVMTAGGPLDLLGINGAGRLVLFELKRGTLTRDAVAQILDYASDLRGRDPDEFAGLVEENSGKNGIVRIDDFSDWYRGEFPDVSDGFYPARADTSEKAHLGPGGVSWQSEGSTARSLNVRRSG